MKNGKEYDTFVEKNIIYDGDQKSILVVRLDIGEKKDLYNKLKILKFSTQSLKTFTWTYHIDKQELVIEDGIENVYSLKIGKNNIQDFAKKIYSKDRKHFFDFWINFTKMNDDEGFINFRMDFFGTDEYEWWESRGKIETETINGKERKYIYGILINIESLKQTENILLENKLNLDALIRQNELIMNNVSVGLVYLDEKLKVQWNNFDTFLPNFFKGKSGCNCKNCDVENKILDFSNKNCFIIKSINLHKSQYKEMEFDGHIFEIASSPVSDSSNNFLGCVLRITDITERKHINNELINAKNKAVQSNLLMRNIFNMLPCLLFIKDVTDGFKYTFVNDKFCDNFNLNQEDILGKTDFEIYDSSIAQSFRDTDLKVIKDEEVHIFDIETPLNNKTLYLQKTKCCITAINGHKIIIGISFDVTDKINSLKELKKAKEKAEESNKLKSAFLANMSHEIRTPLNAIVGFSNILTEEELDDDERVRFCNLINLNNNLLLRLIGDILDLSKIEAGMMVFNPEKFEVSEIFENLKSSINQNINNKDVELLIDIPEKEYYLIHDRNRFIQVVSNFANNAVKFTNEGYIKSGFIPETKGVTVYVEDTGIGIPEDKKERVFERFEKLNDFAQGTGLGMSICKAIMDSCGGKIGVDSVLGQGSRFWAWCSDKMSNAKK